MSTDSDLRTDSAPGAPEASGAPESVPSTPPDTGASNSVGIVQTKYATLFEPPHALTTEGGEQLGPIQVAYETYGTLSPNKDNAIFICHALTGDAHAAGKHSEDDSKSGWWDEFVGPGKGIDTNKYFVICANVLGGCQGTTGPGSINPETNAPYGLEFPVITIQDIVRVHRELVRYLQIPKLLAVIGGSLGGMQVLEWTARYPKDVTAAVVLASSAKVSAQSIAFNTVGRRAILADPKFKNGDFYGEEGPRYGLALARMLAHITYLSETSIERKFGRRLQHSDELTFDLLKETEFQIESYLHYQGKRFVERFDANSYLLLTKAMDYFNIKQSYHSLAEAWQKTTSRFLIASYTTDWLFTTSQSKELVAAMLETGKHVSYVDFDSPFGHDAFLLEFDQLTRLVTPFLEQAHCSIANSDHNKTPILDESGR